MPGVVPQEDRSMLFRLVGKSEAEERATMDALVYPTIATLLITGAVVSMACRTPNEPFRTWFGLLADACGFLLLAAGVHAIAVWGVSRIFRSRLEVPVEDVVRGAWLSVGLLPPFMLLATQGSAWAAAVPPLIAGTAVLFVRRGVPLAGRSANAPAPAGIGSGLFALGEPPMLLRTLLPMVVVAIALERCGGPAALVAVCAGRASTWGGDDGGCVGGAAAPARYQGPKG